MSFTRPAIFAALLLAAAPAAAAPAAAAEDAAPDPVIAFPLSAGEGAFTGLSIVREGDTCRPERSSGNAVTDAFACAGGPRQSRSLNGRVYAMTWRPPAYSGVYVPASVPPAPPVTTRRGRDRSDRNDRVLSVTEFVAVTRLTIDASGRVTECVLESGSGEAEPDARMCNLSTQPRYTPATLDGVPVAERRYALVRLRRIQILSARPPR